MNYSGLMRGLEGCPYKSAAYRNTTDTALRRELARRLRVVRNAARSVGLRGPLKTVQTHGQVFVVRASATLPTWVSDSWPRGVWFQYQALAAKKVVVVKSHDDWIARAV